MCNIKFTYKALTLYIHEQCGSADKNWAIFWEGQAKGKVFFLLNIFHLNLVWTFAAVREETRDTKYRNPKYEIYVSC